MFTKTFLSLRMYILSETYFRAEENEMIAMIQCSFVIVIIKNDTIVGHLPDNILILCNLFLKKGGTISCIITIPCQYSRDSEKGGVMSLVN